MYQRSFNRHIPKQMRFHLLDNYLSTYRTTKEQRTSTMTQKMNAKISHCYGTFSVTKVSHNKNLLHSFMGYEVIC
jgi:hypothetical protein